MQPAAGPVHLTGSPQHRPGRIAVIVDCVRALLVMAALACAAGCQRPGNIKPDDLKPFATDRCTGFPEGPAEQPDLWCHCCVAHDHLYWAGGTYRERVQADQALRVCVTGTGHADTAKHMYAGVRIGGSPYWPSRFRWGFGWPYLRGYKPLSEEERAVTEKLWRDYLESSGGIACPR